MDRRRFLLGSLAGPAAAPIAVQAQRVTRPAPPAAVHSGHVAEILEQRVVLATAYAAHAERFVRKPPAPLTPPLATWVNPPTLPARTEAPHDMRYVGVSK